MLRHTHWVLHHEWGHTSQRGQDHNQQQQELLTAPTLTPPPSPDCRFQNDGSSVSTFSSVSLRSNRSRGSSHQHHGWYCQEPGGHMKINLPIFKDEDKKDTFTYQSWCWDIMVYCQAGCQDHTLLPYLICSLQGYPQKLVRRSATDITLDGVITVLDEHHNSVKALDALNQELFQLWMSNKEIVSDWGWTPQGTSESLQSHSWKGSCQIKSLNWSETASMVGYLSSWR